MESSKPKIAICCIAKDENWYVNDWIGYHLALGFDHVYLYDNNDNIDVGQFIDAKYSDKVTIIDVHGKSQFQRPAYQDCWSRFRHEYDWIAFIDMDEFVTIVEDGKGIKDIMSNPEYSKYDNVRLNWVFLSNQQEIMADLGIPIWERILDRVDHEVEKWVAKSLVNCKSDVIPLPHGAVRRDWTISQCLPNLQEVHSNQKVVKGVSIAIDGIDLSVMYLRHYRTRTLSEYIATKLDRTDVDVDFSKTDDKYFWMYNNRTEEKEMALRKANPKKMRKELEKTWTTRPTEVVGGPGESMFTKVDGLEFLLEQSRFDLIFKYLYAKNPGNSYAKDAYLESIKAFNMFVEHGKVNGQAKAVKNGVCDFVEAFDMLIHRCKQRGGSVLNQIPVQKNGGYLLNGAHRLAVAATLGGSVELSEVDAKNAPDYGYGLFHKRKMPVDVMDYGALEFVKLNKNARIVNLFPVADPGKDKAVEEILNHHGFTYYRKPIDGLNMNGMVNLTKLMYSENGKRERWIGSQRSSFKGAVEHAMTKMVCSTTTPMRVYVFVCNDGEDIEAIKEEIRALFKIGHSSVHINDTHEGSVELASIYFNKNSLDLLNKRDYRMETTELDKKIDEFKSEVLAKGGNLDDFILTGSLPLEAYGIRKARDFDYLTTSNVELGCDFNSHDSQLKYYPTCKCRLVENPRNFFWHRGVKFLSMGNLVQMKKNRAEIGKDDLDCKSIMKLSPPMVELPDIEVGGQEWDVIVSFATHGKRMENDCIYEFLDRIMEQECDVKYKVVANIWKSDYDKAPQKLKDYFNEHGIEVIATDFNYKTHNKYCNVFQKYKGIPIITLDDDQVYRKDAIQLLWNTHLKNPATIVAGSCVVPPGKIMPNGKRWRPQPKTGTGKHIGFEPVGSGGVLYPVEFLQFLQMEDVKNWIMKTPPIAKFDNDMFLFRFAKRRSVREMVVECEHERQTWRGYLVERSLPTADDNTAQTWHGKNKDETKNGNK